MIRFQSLSSGSNGNCYYIEYEGNAILVDIGIGVRTIKKRLAQNGLSLDSVKAVLVTHDHVDHIKSLGTFTDREKRPVYATHTLHKSLNHHFCTRGLLSGCVNYTEEGKPSIIAGFEITPFVVPHDATQTVGYHIVAGDTRLTIITDIGDVTEVAVRYASLADYLVVESNYDLDLLLSGTYPPHLKTRIITGYGHLSNEQTSSLLRRAYSGQWKSVFLCHLSANNNTPQIAYEYARETLRNLGSEASLHCLPRTEASELYIL